MIWAGQNSIAYLCLFKERKNLTLETCAPDFSAPSMAKLYAKSRARAQSHFLNFLKLGRYDDR